MYNENAMNFILKSWLAEALSDQPKLGMYVNNEVAGIFEVRKWGRRKKLGEAWRCASIN